MQLPEPLTSITLLRRLSDPSDPLGWPRFERLYTPLLLRWGRAKGLQEQDAQDVTQAVLITFARQVARFRYDPSLTLRGYLRRLTHAAWCDWVERQRPWHLGSGDPAIHHLLGTLAGRDDPADRLERESDHERLERAMRRVRERVEPRTWEAFRLLALEGLTGEEAAAQLGMKRGSAFAARCKVQRFIRLELDRSSDLGESS